MLGSLNWAEQVRSRNIGANLGAAAKSFIVRFVFSPFFSFSAVRSDLFLPWSRFGRLGRRA